MDIIVRVTSRCVDPVRRSETWFSRNGLPHFVSGYNSREHIWTRALPALVAVMTFQVLGAIGIAVSTGSRLWGALAVGVVAIVLLGMGLWSKRRRGYWFAPADRVRWPVFAVFLICGVLSDVLEGNWGNAVIALGFQLVLLGVIYLMTRYAVLAMIGWGVRQTVRSARDLYVVATKALPLLLIVMIVLFINTEMWQVAGSLDGPVLWASAGLLLTLGVLVTVERTNDQIGTLDRDAPIDEVRRSCIGTPLQTVAETMSAAPDPGIGRAQRRNMLIAALFTKFIQSALIGFLIWLFFIAFGVVAITEPVQSTWMGSLGTADVFWTIGDVHVLSRALVRVATFLGAFAAFYTTIYAASDPVYSASFSDDVGASLQQAVDVRRVYLAAKDA